MTTPALLAYVDELLSSDRVNLTASTLDAKAHALVRLGALIAIDAETPAYMWTLESARRAGASNDEIVGCLLALMPTLGVARVVSADTVAVSGAPGTAVVRHRTGYYTSKSH